ncbi:hypothetical protein AK830_g12452 [Neonectria ditissima]|uniref:Uncharacterized protein n=1 Tax=Neonectria ditissima TaxID=78410 RepID=A0A0P7B3D4_9HYPO|nr:hypothetical protein AK830_g12452 [Neonectria ditissima]
MPRQWFASAGNGTSHKVALAWPVPARLKRAVSIGRCVTQLDELDQNLDAGLGLTQPAAEGGSLSQEPPDQQYACVLALTHIVHIVHIAVRVFRILSLPFGTTMPANLPRKCQSVMLDREGLFQRLTDAYQRFVSWRAPGDIWPRLQYLGPIYAIGDVNAGRSRRISQVGGLDTYI